MIRGEFIRLTKQDLHRTQLRLGVSARPCPRGPFLYRGRSTICCSAAPASQSQHFTHTPLSIIKPPTSLFILHTHTHLSLFSNPSFIYHPFLSFGARSVFPVMPRSIHIAQLVTTLGGLIGRDNARLELKWLKQAIQSAKATRVRPFPSLPTMLSRRVRGEPLQYILGMTSPPLLHQ